ncbi:hypothetical protein Tco_0530211 [Tanacetum coccineum]
MIGQSSPEHATSYLGLTSVTGAIARPPVNGGQLRTQRWSTTVNGGGPPPDHWSTTVGPPVNGGQTLVNGSGQPGHGPGQVGSRSGLGPGYHNDVVLATSAAYEIVGVKTPAENAAQVNSVNHLALGFLVEQTSVIGGGVDVDCCGGGVKDGNDCGMTVEYTSEESMITGTGTVRIMGVCWLGTS